jgi:hypothetical protein
MVRVDFEALGLNRPALTDEFIRCLALQGLRSPRTVVGQKEGMEMRLNSMADAKWKARTVASLMARFIRST